MVIVDSTDKQEETAFISEKHSWTIFPDYKVYDTIRL